MSGLLLGELGKTVKALGQKRLMFSHYWSNNINLNAIIIFNF